MSVWLSCQDSVSLMEDILIPVNVFTSEVRPTAAAELLIKEETYEAHRKGSCLITDMSHYLKQGGLNM